MENLRVRDGGVCVTCKAPSKQGRYGFYLSAGQSLDLGEGTVQGPGRRGG
jgi:hypothetical protein